jgi:hypothetical protein
LRVRTIRRRFCASKRIFIQWTLPDANLYDCCLLFS